MSKSWTTRHDGGLIDGHCIFSKIGNDGMAGLMIGCDSLVLLVDFNAPSFGALYEQNKIKRSFSDINTKRSPLREYEHCVHSPMRILSLANSRSFSVTISFPSTAAFRAAWFTRFSSSAPEKPTVPRAIISASTAVKQRLLHKADQRSIHNGVLNRTHAALKRDI